MEKMSYGEPGQHANGRKLSIDPWVWTLYFTLEKNSENSIFASLLWKIGNLSVVDWLRFFSSINWLDCWSTTEDDTEWLCEVDWFLLLLRVYTKTSSVYHLCLISHRCKSVVGGSIDLLRTFGFSVIKNFEIKEPLVPGFSEKF